MKWMNPGSNKPWALAYCVWVFVSDPTAVRFCQLSPTLPSKHLNGPGPVLRPACLSFALLCCPPKPPLSIRCLQTRARKQRPAGAHALSAWDHPQRSDAGHTAVVQDDSHRKSEEAGQRCHHHQHRSAVKPTGIPNGCSSAGFMLLSTAHVLATIPLCVWGGVGLALGVVQVVRQKGALWQYCLTLHLTMFLYTG